ncbi:MAG: flagellar hook-length control protein FliK [Nitrospinae bacterium]|nr:flagellar hook-length control protein FliK [Nitrospinota bacterium]
MNTNSIQLESAANLLNFSANLNQVQNIAGDQKFDQVFREVSQKPLASPQEPKKASSMEKAGSAQGQGNSKAAETETSKPDQAVSRKQPETDNKGSEIAAAADSAGPEKKDLPEAESANNVETNPADAQAGISSVDQGIILAAGAAEALKAALMLQSDANAANGVMNASADINSLLTEPGKAMASFINNNEQSGSAQGIMPQDVLQSPSQTQEAAIESANNVNQQLAEVLSSATPAETASSLEKTLAPDSTGLNAMGIDSRTRQADMAASSQAEDAINQSQAEASKAKSDAAQVVDAANAQAKVDSGQAINNSQAAAEANKGQEAALPAVAAQSSSKEIFKVDPKAEPVKGPDPLKQKSLEHLTKQVQPESSLQKNTDGENSGGNVFSMNALKRPEKTENSLDPGAGKIEFQSFAVQENAVNQPTTEPAPTANTLGTASVTGEIRRGDFHASHLSEKAAMKGEIKPQEVFERSVLDQIVSKASLINRNGQNEMRIQLDPPSLGTIKVQVSVAGDNVTAKLMTDNSIARDILEKNIHQLRDSFSEQGLKVQQMSVHVGNDPRQQAADHFRPFYMEKGFSRMNSAGAGEDEQMNQPVLSRNGAGYSDKGGISVFA